MFKSVWLIACTILSFPTVTSADPGELSPYSRAVLIHESSTESGPFEFIVGSVEKIKRNARIDGALYGTGDSFVRTYELPAATRRELVMDYFVDQLNAMDVSILFQCEGRDCGRATTWASEVFKRRELSAPNPQQAYVAAVKNTPTDQLLLSVYVVERGNRKVLSHILEIRPEKSIEIDLLNQDDTTTIVPGLFVLDSQPNLDGTFEVGVLDSVVNEINQLVLPATGETYVVCHLQHQTLKDAADQILESFTCAESITEAVTATQLIPLGVGPLQPRSNAPNTRIEIVTTSLL